MVNVRKEIYMLYVKPNNRSYEKWYKNMKVSVFVFEILLKVFVFKIHLHLGVFVFDLMKSICICI